MGVIENDKNHLSFPMHGKKPIMRKTILKKLSI